MFYRDIPERPLAFDIRVDREDDAQRWKMASDYSIWPDNPFGASVDTEVWPTIFDQTVLSADKFVKVPVSSEYWHAFNMWDDFSDMLSTIDGKPGLKGEAIVICIDEYSKKMAIKNTLTDALLQNTPTGIHLNSEIFFLGYDVCDSFMMSMIFNALSNQEIKSLAPKRTVHGLIKSREEAITLIPVMEKYDFDHAPLLIMSVYSIGKLAQLSKS